MKFIEVNHGEKMSFEDTVEAVMSFKTMNNFLADMAKAVVTSKTTLNAFDIDNRDRGISLDIE